MGMKDKKVSLNSTNVKAIEEIYSYQKGIDFIELANWEFNIPNIQEFQNNLQNATSCVDKFNEKLEEGISLNRQLLVEYYKLSETNKEYEGFLVTNQKYFPMIQELVIRFKNKMLSPFYTYSVLSISKIADLANAYDLLKELKYGICQYDIKTKPYPQYANFRNIDNMYKYYNNIMINFHKLIGIEEDLTCIDIDPNKKIYDYIRTFTDYRTKGLMTYDKNKYRLLANNEKNT